MYSRKHARNGLEKRILHCFKDCRVLQITAKWVSDWLHVNSKCLARRFHLFRYGGLCMNGSERHFTGNPFSLSFSLHLDLPLAPSILLLLQHRDTPYLASPLSREGRVERASQTPHRHACFRPLSLLTLAAKPRFLFFASPKYRVRPSLMDMKLKS